MSVSSARNYAQQAIATAGWAYHSSNAGRQEIEHLANAVRQTALAIEELTKVIDQLTQRQR